MGCVTHRKSLRFFFDMPEAREYDEKEDMFNVFPPEKFRRRDWELGVLMSG